MMSLFPEDLTALAERVILENRALGRHVALAESCTGGLVCGLLTEIPGSSDVVGRGFVTYSNEAKMELLGVHADMIETFGAVSVATAWAMAQGALERSHADIAVAVTGIAGPGGGTAQKPVGTVVFARAMRGANPEDVVADLKTFDDHGRTAIRLQAVRVALELLLPGAETPEASAT
ncbi:CinA family protein [Pacificimonas sp. WHA3]|uniref:CinA family protein n=1 Tax=Pacificimonas pallii TaxID=2827236 RepID=A0ABS6SDK3_9SPHN|nr:CinA family protein [Pacificimonas pallii]MBV7256497.1 CinA family protein [Pacificimonas pallii]